MDDEAPLYSRPLVASEALPPTDSFGDTWQEFATRVEAFVINATDKILAIHNLTHEETRRSIQAYTKRGSTQLFVLHPGEHILQVDVRYTMKVIKAIKVHTNKRVTPWFGKTKGWSRQVSIKGGNGSCINALRGKYGPEGCTELGVVWMPKAIAEEGHSMVQPKEVTRLTVPLDDEADGELELWTFDATARAIVVTTGQTSLQNIRVLSAVEYERVANSSESFEGGENEQWLVLVEGERVEAVGVDVEDKRIKSIAFQTNLQTTHSFGEANNSERQWLFAPEGSYVCGFELLVAHLDDEPTITDFQVLCARAPETTKEQQASKAA